MQPVSSFCEEEDQALSSGRFPKRFLVQHKVFLKLSVFLDNNILV